MRKLEKTIPFSLDDRLKELGGNSTGNPLEQIGKSIGGALGLDQ